MNLIRGWVAWGARAKGGGTGKYQYSAIKIPANFIKIALRGRPEDHFQMICKDFLIKFFQPFFLFFSQNDE